jgi:O-antigen/teichoic acid export membrane protein
MSIARRSIQSSTYTIASSGLQTLILLVRSILLARILAPSDFGVYTLAFSTVILTNSFGTFGLTAAYLNRTPESDDAQAVRVHFTLTILFSLIWLAGVSTLGFILFSVENRWVFWAIAATQLIDNLTATPRAMLAREVQHRRIAIIEFINTGLTTVVAISLALAGYGIFSLVATDIVAAIVGIAGYYLFYPFWRPGFSWTPHLVRYFINFGRRSFFATLLGESLDKVDDIWTGLYLGDIALGFYSRAYVFATYPRRIVANPVSDVAASIYAALKYNKSQLGRAFHLINTFLIRVGFAMAGILALIAPEFILIFLGEKWLPMLVAFRLMLLYIMLDPIKHTIANLFIAIGKPEIIIKIRLIQLCVLMIGLLIFADGFGIAGIAIAVNLMALAGIILLLIRAKMEITVTIHKLFVVPVIGLVSGLLITYLVIPYAWLELYPWLSLCVKSGIFIVIYSGVVGILERQEILEAVKLIKEHLGS